MATYPWELHILGLGTEAPLAKYHRQGFRDVGITCGLRTHASNESRLHCDPGK